MEVVSNEIVNNIWGSGPCEYSYLASEGMAGGLLSVWNSSTVSVLSSFRGRGFLGSKKELWKNLLEVKQKFLDGEWIFGEDFNAVKCRNERVGRSLDSNSSEMREFSDFIEVSELVDVPCKGKKYSWFSGDGNSRNRINRFLMADNVVSLWGVVGQIIGARDISDHCPIWLEVDKLDWGPKPFKFNNEWFSHKEFVPFVEKEWEKMVVRGRGDFVLKENFFKLIKERLRWWDKTVFGKFDLEVEEGVRDLNDSDDIEVLDAEKLSLKRDASNRIWLNLKIKENMLIQKSRLNWLNDGDSNSKFFHRFMKERRRRNHISSIVTNNGMVDSVKEVKEAVEFHFESKFAEECVDRPLLEGIEFNFLSLEESLSLEVPFMV
ncbi:uncharacterized protein LOC131624805 [Vicia villosa]|uniref:uncharacterized protein LOC131624805 n=1 Tax=Vicia villosa TaxID=3911 RepID=UPI00273B9D25|nr:uncharacterized protein LOC131624805 [Vicia villosa]